jgi:signal transduction histidine kinase
VIRADRARLRQVLEARDVDVGIPAAALPHVFDQFLRAAEDQGTARAIRSEHINNAETELAGGESVLKALGPLPLR